VVWREVKIKTLHSSGEWGRRPGGKGSAWYGTTFWLTLKTKKFKGENTETCKVTSLLTRKTFSFVPERKGEIRT